MTSRKRNALPQEYLNVYDTIANADGSITAEKILLQLGKEQSYKRQLHRIIHNLVVEHGVPIGSSSKEGISGYFIMQTPQQHLEAVKSLSSRVDKINKRAAAIKKSFSKLSGQNLTNASIDEVRAAIQQAADEEDPFNTQEVKEFEEDFKNTDFDELMDDDTFKRLEKELDDMDKN